MDSVKLQADPLFPANLSFPQFLWISLSNLSHLGFSLEISLSCRGLLCPITFIRRRQPVAKAVIQVYKCLTSLSQYGTTLKGHPRYRAPSRLTEASATITLWVDVTLDPVLPFSFTQAYHLRTFPYKHSVQNYSSHHLLQGTHAKAKRWLFTWFLSAPNK